MKTSLIDQLYQQMARPRTKESYEKRLQRTRLLFRAAFAAWIIALGSTALAVYVHFSERICTTDEPLLKGPPQFILLALLVAFSAYLRQVHSGALDQRDKIRKGKMWNYPLHPPYHKCAEAKMKSLDDVARSLTIASPFLIWLFLLLSFRIFFESTLRFAPTIHYPKWIYVLDLAISFWVLVVFVIPSVSHWRARRRDDNIRAVARAFENDVAPSLGVAEQAGAQKQPSPIQHQMWADNPSRQRASASAKPRTSDKESDPATTAALLLTFMALFWYAARQSRDSTAS